METKELIQARKLIDHLAFVMVYGGTKNYSREVREQLSKEAYEWLAKNQIPIISEYQP